MKLHDIEDFASDAADYADRYWKLEMLYTVKTGDEKAAVKAEQKTILAQLEKLPAFAIAAFCQRVMSYAPTLHVAAAVLTVAANRLSKIAEAQPDEEDDGERFKLQCPKCEHKWRITNRDVRVYSCQSGGVYANYIDCPKCHYEQDVHES